MCSICKKDVSWDQSAEVNCAPLSEVIVCGTPNLVIQEEQKTSAQAEAVVEDRGTGDGLRPSCSAINHGKNVCVSL